MKLNDRLDKIAGQINAGETMADIGTDHGFLPIYLKKTGKCPHVIMTDISRGSLDKAVRDCEIYEPGEPFDLRIGDGLTVLKPGEVNDVVIAGMGGSLIADIMGADPGLSSSFGRFILQPRNNIGKLRASLSRMGFVITKEQLAEEGRFLCVIITCEYREGSEQGDAMEDFALRPWEWDFPDSLIRFRGAHTADYLNRELRRNRRILTRIHCGAADPVTKAAAERTEHYIEQLEGLLEQLKEMDIHAEG